MTENISYFLHYVLYVNVFYKHKHVLNLDGQTKWRYHQTAYLFKLDNERCQFDEFLVRDFRIVQDQSPQGISLSVQREEQHGEDLKLVGGVFNLATKINSGKRLSLSMGGKFARLRGRIRGKFIKMDYGI